MEKQLYEKYKEIAKFNKSKILKTFETTNNGKKSSEAEYLLNKNGLNVYIKENNHGPIYFFFNSLKDPFILILFFLAIVNYMLGDKLGSIVIVLIGLISALIRFIQDYSEYKFNQKLKAKIFSEANVIRDGKEKDIKVEEVVVGDIVNLNAGSVIPADMILIESKDLFVNQSVFTGESVPIEKSTTIKESSNIFDINNICLMESSGRYYLYQRYYLI